jgi:metal-sulfur cluster biosynthetic enzyme
MTVEAGARAALHEVYDPCSQAWGRPLSLLDLGLVREVSANPQGQVTVRLSLTTPFCMGLATIMKSVEQRVMAVPDVAEVIVEIDPCLPWSPELMTEEGRERLARSRAADRLHTIGEGHVRH